MDLLQRYLEHIKREQLFSANAHLLLAVSGGLDSVALTELCKQAGFDFSIAHCNFQLRGEESLRDEEFVKAMAGRYGVKLYLERFNTEGFAKENKLSIQEAARSLRYTFFKEIIRNWEKANTVSSKPILLITAHHRDDNVETVLMNFLRGTGLHGLTGIPASNDDIRRPLLPFSRTDLATFVKENGLAFVEDSSNLSSKYTRNYLRNEWIPAIEKIYPQVKENISDNIERFKSVEKLYHHSLEGLRRKLINKKGGEIHIPANLLMKYGSRALVYDIIAEHGFSEGQVDEVIKLSKAGSGKYIDAASGNKRIIRHRRWFIIAPVQSNDTGNIIIGKEDGNIEFSRGVLKLSFLSPSMVNDQAIACIDAATIEFPLLLRRAKTGDYFYPLGMKKKKKVSRFLIDQKLSKTEKENTWVVASGDRIIWILGQRIDDRVKITPKTGQMLMISFSSRT